jgi:hypothetical protein
MSVVFRNLRSASAAAFRAFQIKEKSVTSHHDELSMRPSAVVASRFFCASRSLTRDAGVGLADGPRRRNGLILQVEPNVPTDQVRFIGGPSSATILDGGLAYAFNDWLGSTERAVFDASVAKLYGARSAGHLLSSPKLADRFCSALRAQHGGSS